jgi:DNA polymerase-1
VEPGRDLVGAAPPPRVAIVGNIQRMGKAASQQKRFLEFDVDAMPPPGAASPRPASGSSKVPAPGPDDGSVYVLDAHALIYQVFFAVGQMSSPGGQPVNAIFGFLRDVLDIVEKRKPGFLICTFDRGDVTFRNEMFADYKANRQPMPDDLRAQIPPIQEMLSALGIPVLAIANYEADDIMATIAREVRDRGGRCFLVTNDKDCRQLISDTVKIYNIRKNLVYDEEALQKDWGIRPDQVVDFQAMVGDPVDNVPGIPSIGPKTACQLLGQFGTLERVIAEAGTLKSARQRETILAHADAARTSRNLVRLDDRVPIEIDWAAARVGANGVARALEMCNELGFRSMATRIASWPGAEAPEEWETSYRTIATAAELEELLRHLAGLPRISFDTETTAASPRAAELVGFSLSWDTGVACYVPVRAPAGQPFIEEAEALRILRPLMENAQQEKIGQNLKYDLIVMRNLGVHLAGPLFDTMVADYLLEAGQRNHGIDDLARRYFNHRNIRMREVTGRGAGQRLMDEVHIDRVRDYAAEDADIPFRLYPVLTQRLEEAGLVSLFRDLEMPLIGVLADMEFHGIRVDVRVLERLSSTFATQIESLRQEICMLAGGEFNIDSPKQLATVLFDQLKLPVVRKTATGRGTSVDVLEALAEHHPLPAKIIEYRQFAKLRSTYTEALIRLVNPKTGRVHTSFMQDVAATGRLSSKDPNLQNIPIRTEAGRAIRHAFVADPPGWQLLSADYSQIELRMLAHFTNDEVLVAAFESGQDIHAAVAAEIHGVPIGEVTADMRRAAKTVNFGIIYGQTPFGLARSIGVSKEEASQFIDAYMARYPSVGKFAHAVLADAHRKGHVTTILGRRRRIDGVRDPEKGGVRRFLNVAERTAINSVIQGSAADLIKLAMVNLHRRLAAESISARILLQIHDELVLEVPDDELHRVAGIVHQEMVAAVPLRVPIQVDLSAGSDWGSTHPIDFPLSDS